MKRLLNRCEESTNSVLQRLTEAWGAHTFAKIRLADVLPIENSGIDTKSYRFALQSHFDFVISDSDFVPLFAVEFDGPTHCDAEQKRRDGSKNRLCEQFKFPLLRINSRYLDGTYRKMNVLSWFVNYWFAQQAIDEAYNSGHIPPEADVDPMLMMSLPGSNEGFPLWLSAEVRIAFKKYRDEGLCLDMGPSSYVGLDEDGNYRAISYIAVTSVSGLMSETGMRSQIFPAPCAELVVAIADHQVFDEFKAYAEKGFNLVPLDDIAVRVMWFRKSFEMLMSSSCTQARSIREFM